MNIYKMLQRGAGIAALMFLAQTALAQTPASLNASVLPSSRATAINTTVTVFATITNGGDTAATGCRVSVFPVGTPAGISFSYRAFQNDNATPAAPTDTPVDIAGHASQSFVLALTPANVFVGTDIKFDFSCDGPVKAPVIKGVNTLFLAAASAATPDIITIATTPTGNGVVGIATLGGVEAMGVAAVNIGSGLGTVPILVAADTGDNPLPLDIFVCETDPVTAVCKNPPAAVVGTVIGSTPSTFSVFANSTRGAGVPNFPDMARLHMRYFEDLALGDMPQGASKPAFIPPFGAGDVFGATSTGVTSPGPDSTAADTFPTGIYRVRYQPDNGTEKAGWYVVDEFGNTYAGLYDVNSAAFPSPYEFMFGFLDNISAANGSAQRTLTTSYSYITQDMAGNFSTSNFNGAGVWEPKSNALVSYTPPGPGESAGHFKAVYTGDFDRTISLAGLAGSYDGVDQDVNTGALSGFGNITIAADGTLSGTVNPDLDQTCTVSGSLSAFPNGGNMFDLAMTLSGPTCAVAGAMIGIAFMNDMIDKANNKVYKNALSFLFQADAAVFATFGWFVPAGTVFLP